MEPITCQFDTETQSAIDKTLLTATNDGRVKELIKNIKFALRVFVKQGIDLFNPEAVKNYIATGTYFADRNKPQNQRRQLTNEYKNLLVQYYNYFCEANNIQWTPPFYRTEQKTPITPTTDNINRIISCSSKKFIPIFTLLAETAIEGKELETTPNKQIDIQQGIISVQGHKRHNSGTYTLTEPTRKLLEGFLAKYSYSEQYPFPKSKTMQERWLDARTIAIKKYNDPELKKIPFKNLRNYAGSQNYYKFKDPIETKRFMRHKRLDQTMHYLDGMPRATEGCFIYKIANTPEEAGELIMQGFKEASVYYMGTPNEKHLFAKPK